MAEKINHGLDIYDLLIDLVMNLSPLQAKKLYSELGVRYNKRARTKLYNKDGELDENGKVRLTEYQYKAIRTKFGDSYVKKAFNELTNYIIFLENNQETSSKYKQKLRDYNSKTHNNRLIEDGWVYEKCKQYICNERPKLNINPYTIEDINTAREYIKHIPEEIRATAMDVQLLIMKFPELQDVEYEQ